MDSLPRYKKQRQGRRGRSHTLYWGKGVALLEECSAPARHKPGALVHACSPTLRKWKQDDQVFKNILICITSSKVGWEKGDASPHRSWASCPTSCPTPPLSSDEMCMHLHPLHSQRKVKTSSWTLPQSNVPTRHLSRHGKSYA